MKRLKQERGSITLFVLVSMLFFILFLAGIYMMNASKEQTGISETARIKEIYEKDINQIDSVYETVEEGLKRNLKDVVQIGDYVAYDPTEGVIDTSKLTYTSPIGTGMSHGNGYSEQKFTATNSTKWRVLGKDEITGGVVLISEIPINTDEGKGLGMRGAIGYLYAEQELNEICKIYGYGKGANTSRTFSYKIGDTVEGLEEGTIQGSGARSINAEDINKITKYNPKTYTYESGGITYKYGDAYTHSIFYPTKTTENGKSINSKQRREEWTMYWYQALEYLTDIESPMYKILFSNNYWLASRGVSSDLGHVGFCEFLVSGGCKGSFGLCHGYSDRLDEYDNALAVRPIVYLKSNIKTSGQDESGVWMISE